VIPPKPPGVSRVLGLALVVQFATSFSSGVFLKSAWFVPEDMSATMLSIAANPGFLRTGVFLDTLTALGVIVLGAVLFAVSRMNAFALRGLISLIPLLIGTIVGLFGYSIPFFFYVPFELVVDVWILIRGVLR
jgi:hypothetical protein